MQDRIAAVWQHDKHHKGGGNRTTNKQPVGTQGGHRGEPDQEGSNLLFTCGFSGDNQTTIWMVDLVWCANSSVIFLSKTCHSVAQC